MDSFDGKLAVVTGGGSGIGRELVVQLAAEGCSVATCDLSQSGLDETAVLARAGAPDRVRVTSYRCDVTDEQEVNGFRDDVLAQHQARSINLLFNNAGISGGFSFVAGDRESWERTFSVCWYGVYNCSRAFVPLLVAGNDGYLVNVSSVAGFWATDGTAYSAAKFAVKGFSEALIDDLREHAPHVKVAVVMSGGLRTSLFKNSVRVLGPGGGELFECVRRKGTPAGRQLKGASDDEQRQLLAEFLAARGLGADVAASSILAGVRTGGWRILVGDFARRADEAVRADPEGAYREEPTAFLSHHSGAPARDESLPREDLVNLYFDVIDEPGDSTSTS